MSDALSIGCTVPTSGKAADPAALGALAQAAEALGFDSIWIPDHVVVPERIGSSYPYSVDGQFPVGPTQPYLEPLATLAYLAGVTKRVRLGTAVLVLPYRHPLLAAKMLATIDNLSGGRVDFGIGVGWMREEFEALGSPPYERRGAVTDEQLRLMQAVWTQDVTGFEGEFYRFEPLGAHPRPIQQPHPPIYVGGHTPPALRRTARFGDVWLPLGARPPANLPPSEIKDLFARVRAEAERIGRDPNAIDVCFGTMVGLDAARDRPFNGTVDEIVRDFVAYRQVGVHRFMVGMGSAPPAEVERRLRRFAEEVRPALAAAPVG